MRWKQPCKKKYGNDFAVKFFMKGQHMTTKLLS